MISLVTWKSHASDQIAIACGIYEIGCSDGPSAGFILNCDGNQSAIFHNGRDEASVQERPDAGLHNQFIQFYFQFLRVEYKVATLRWFADKCFRL